MVNYMPSPLVDEALRSGFRWKGKLKGKRRRPFFWVAFMQKTLGKRQLESLLQISAEFSKLHPSRTSSFGVNRCSVKIDGPERKSMRFWHRLTGSLRKIARDAGNHWPAIFFQQFSGFSLVSFRHGSKRQQTSRLRFVVLRHPVRSCLLVR